MRGRSRSSESTFGEQLLLLLVVALRGCYGGGRPFIPSRAGVAAVVGIFVSFFGCQLALFTHEQFFVAWYIQSKYSLRAAAAGRNRMLASVQP